MQESNIVQFMTTLSCSKYTTKHSLCWSSL